MHPIERAYAAFLGRFRSQVEGAEAGQRSEAVRNAEFEDIPLSHRAALHFLGVRPSDPDFVAAIRFAAELQAWVAYRRHRQLYVVDERLAEALSTASWPEDLDVASLFLPVPGAAISVRLPGGTAQAHFIGFYDLETEAGGGAARRQIRFAQLRSDGELIPCGSVILVGGRLEDALRTETAAIRHYVAARSLHVQPDALTPRLKQGMTTLDGVMLERGQLLRQLLNVLLYINGNDDVVARVHSGKKPVTRGRRPRSVKREQERQEATVFDVGRAFASTIQHWEEEERARNVGGTVDGDRQVRPHVRRAHLHLYWTGPGRETARFKLVKPTLIHGGGASAASTRRIR